MNWSRVIGLMVLGAIIGAAALDEGGLLAGAVIGWLAARVQELGDRLQTLERRLTSAEPRPMPQLHPDQPPTAQAPAAQLPSRAVTPPAPPSALAAGFARALTFFTTGNVVAKVGVVVLFIGVAFLVNYAIENALLPPELRLAGAALLGVALLAIGFRLRHRADAYGLLLQGAGVGVLYLSVFAAFRLYELLPAGAAFALLVVIVAASSLLAVRQNSEAMAALGLAGGFLAPILTSTGGGSHVALFSYYVLLNLGILGMAWFRSWRWVNLLGFVFTFGIGMVWGARDYQVQHFVSVEAFLIYFFLHYVVVGVLFARSVESARAAGGNLSAAMTGAVNGTLVFGLPITVFGLQAVLVEGKPFALAYSALAVAAVYMLAAWVARRLHFRRQAGLPAAPALLGESYLALVLIFASLAIPFAVADQRWTAAAWALEGAGLVWLGLRQQRLFNRLFGLFLQLAAAVAFVAAAFDGDYDGVTGFALACVMLSVAAWFISYIYTRPFADDARGARWLSGAFMVWAWPWWVAAALVEILERTDHNDAWRLPALLVVGAASAAGMARIGGQLAWPAARRSGYAWLPVVLLMTLVFGLFGSGLYGSAGSAALRMPMLAWSGWLAALAALWSCLHSLALGRAAVPTSGLLPIWHAASMLGATLVLVLLWHAQLQPRVAWDSGWLQCLPGLIPAIVIATLPTVAARWPVVDFKTSYLQHAQGLLSLWLLAWVALFGFVRGLSSPLPYLPIANAFELTQVAALLLAYRWMHVAYPQHAPVLAGIAAFAFINQVALRGVHVFAGVEFSASAMGASALAQTTLSLLWTLLALGAMFSAARRALRSLWLVGAALLAAVVLKLLLVDMPGIGTIPRIVSFIGVGCLMLLIGYLAPLPPAADGRSAEGVPEA